MSSTIPRSDDVLHLQEVYDDAVDSPSVSTNKEGKELSLNNSLHYQSAEVPWKTAIILSRKYFPAINVPRASIRALSGQEQHKLAVVSSNRQVRMLEGEQERTSKFVEHECHVDTDTISVASYSRGAQLNDVLTGMKDLTNVLNSRRNYFDVDRHHPFILKRPKRFDLDEQSSMLVGMHDLAKIVAARGRYKQAEGLFRSLVGLIEQELELDDSELSDAMDNLVMIYTKLGREEEAEAVYKKTLRLRNKCLTWDDPKTQEILEHLCKLLKKRRKAQEAVELAQTYRLPSIIKSIMLALHRCTNCHVGLIDDHHDDEDVQKFLRTDVSVIEDMRLFPEDDSIAIELILDPEDFRLVLILSRRALMTFQEQLIVAIKHSLEYGLGEWKDMGIDTYVCLIDQDEDRALWALPHHLDL